MLVAFRLVSGKSIWLNPHHVESLVELGVDKDHMPTSAIRMASGEVHAVVDDPERAADIIDASSEGPVELSPEALLTLAAAALRGADVVAQGVLGDNGRDAISADDALDQAKLLIEGARGMVEINSI